MSGSARMDFPDTATADEHVCVFDMDADACLICGRTAEEAAKLEAAQERRELAAVGGILAKVSPTAWKYSQELKAQVPKPIQSRVEWQRSPETCRMACLCMSCLGCMAVSIVLYGLWGLIYDENECSSGSHNCSTFARCEDRSGTYQCFCHDGYYGDGWDCRDIDECLDPDRLGCDPNAECENSAGSFACECDEGYLGTGDPTGLGGRGVECADIDECLDDNGGCGPALYNLCLNEPSTWTCT